MQQLLLLLMLSWLFGLNLQLSSEDVAEAEILSFFISSFDFGVKNSDSRHLVQLCAIFSLKKVRQAAVSTESEQMIIVYRSSVTVQLCFGSFVLSVSLGLLLLTQQTYITKLVFNTGSTVNWSVSW